MDLDPRQLEALSAAVDEGTLEAAARRLHVTASAVSQRIKALETSVGRVLLTRSKPVRPTPSGEALVRAARQLRAVAAEVEVELGGEEAGARTSIAVAVNADSLATWFLPALAALAPRFDFDLRRGDEEQTAGLLRDGTVMAAVTAQAEPVPGCSVARLGRMRYRPRASPAFAATWFPDGPTAEALAAAPVVEFDREDTLQAAYLRRRSRRRLQPPRHYVPASADYARAIALGLGWGMVPDIQLAGAGELVEIDPDGAIDVRLFWQRWRLRTTALTELSEAVRDAAAAALR